MQVPPPPCHNGTMGSRTLDKGSGKDGFRSAVWMKRAIGRATTTGLLSARACQARRSPLILLVRFESRMWVKAVKEEGVHLQARWLSSSPDALFGTLQCVVSFVVSCTLTLGRASFHTPLQTKPLLGTD